MKRSTKWAIAVALVLWVALFFGAIAYAGSITLSCTAPTQNEDGTPLTDLAGYKFYYGIDQGGPYPNMRSRNATACAYVIEDLVSGDYYIVATAFNDAGIESVFSNEATKTVPVSPPAPPGNLVVGDSLIAYGISQTKDRLVTYPVGTVPLGTPCDSSMSANGMNLIPFDAVVFVGSVRPEVMVAKCGAG